MTQRRGFTLVEVLVALLIMGVVTGAIYKLLNTNQRLAVAQAEQVTLQSNVRTGSLIVPNELRELNTMTLGTGAQNDIIAATASTIEYRASRGMGFLCEVPGANSVKIAQSSWTGSRPPLLARDDLYLFVDGDKDDDDDDSWLQMDITNVTTSVCAGGAPGWTLAVAGVPAGVLVNTPVRLFERMRMELGSVGGQWWLQARSVTAGEALTPVLGPLTSTGFALQYFDSTGATTADLNAVKSIRITVQGLTDGAVRRGGTAAAATVQDTLTTQVLLRNSVRPKV